MWQTTDSSVLRCSFIYLFTRLTFSLCYIRIYRAQLGFEIENRFEIEKYISMLVSASDDNNLEARSNRSSSI